MSSSLWPRLSTFTRHQILLTIAVTAVLLLVVAQTWRSLAGITLDLTFSWAALAQGVALGAGISLASALVFWIWPAYRERALEYMRLVLVPLNPVDCLWLGLLPGLSEELLFRGVALPTLGLVLSSALFGALHILDLKYWPYAVWTTCLGFVLGLAVQMSGTLLVPVVAHILVNWLSCLFWYGRLRRASGA